MTNTSITRNFRDDCRVINMGYEYPGYTGQEQWLIVSELSKTEIMEQYAQEVKQYCPFLYMTPETFDPVVKFHSNNRKHEMRAAKYGDAFSYEDEEFERFHPELVEDPFSEPDWSSLYDAMNNITTIQYARIQKRYFQKMSLVEIARDEGTTKQAIEKSIRMALETMKKILLEG